MTIKERVDEILGRFLERNRNYAVELYLRNAVTNSSMGRIFITSVKSDRIYEINDKGFILKWNKDKNYDVRYNEFLILYDDVIACYEVADKDDKLKISETVVMILKNGMRIDFECFGMRI